MYKRSLFDGRNNSSVKMSCEWINADASSMRMPFPKEKKLKLKLKRKNQVTDNTLDPTERKPTRPSKVSTGSRKKQKTNEEEVELGGTIQSIFRTEEDQFRKTLEAEYCGYRPNEVEDPRMVKHQSLLLDSKKEKTDVIEEVIEEGTSVSEKENAVNNLLKELDCFELKRQDNVEKKTAQTNPEMHPLDPDHLLCCPIHEVFVERKVSQKGWEYIKCPHATCPLFAFALDMLPYMSAVKSQLHEELKQKWNNLVCCCSRSMTLSVSKSEKNPGRLYLRCNNNQYEFFQWADVPLTQKNRDWIEGNTEPHPGAYRFPQKCRDTEAYPLRSYINPDPCPRPVRGYVGKKLLWDEAEEAVRNIVVIDCNNRIVDPPELSGYLYQPECKEQYVQKVYDIRRNGGLKM